MQEQISNSIFYTLGLYDIWNLLDNQQKETLTEAINIGINEGLKANPVENRVMLTLEEIIKLMRTFNRPMKTGEIAEQINKEKSNVSRLLGKLMADGLVYSPSYGIYALTSFAKEDDTQSTQSVKTVEKEAEKTLFDEDKKGKGSKNLRLKPMNLSEKEEK